MPSIVLDILTIRPYIVAQYVQPHQVTPLHLACREGHLNVVNTLIKNGADITKCDQTDNNALDLAIENGHE